jgi:simple sugar transport system substrate-binding protein
MTVTRRAPYGEHLMEALAKVMNYEGEYAVYVGSLISKTHNEWVDGAVALQKSKYPKMKLIADKIETNDDQQIAYAKTKELLRAHPNVKGFEGRASTDVAGIGLAIEEAGLPLTRVSVQQSGSDDLKRAENTDGM